MGKKKDSFDELGFDSTVFESIEKDFQEVIDLFRLILAAIKREEPQEMDRNMYSHSTYTYRFFLSWLEIKV